MHCVHCHVKAFADGSGVKVQLDGSALVFSVVDLTTSTTTTTTTPPTAIATTTPQSSSSLTLGLESSTTTVTGPSEISQSTSLIPPASVTRPLQDVATTATPQRTSAARGEISPSTTSTAAVAESTTELATSTQDPMNPAGQSNSASRDGADPSGADGNAGIIAGSVIACVLLIGAVVLVVYFLVIRKANSTSKKPRNPRAPAWCTSLLVQLAQRCLPPTLLNHFPCWCVLR